MSADYENLIGLHNERIRLRAEKAVRRLIHAKHMTLLRRAHASLRGITFRSIRDRSRRAQELTGLMRDEVYGGILESDAAMSINRTKDIRESHYSGESILAQARTVGIGEDAIVKCIVSARSEVRESKRLLKARDAAQRADATDALDAPTSADVLSVSKRFGRGRRRLSTSS